jgi:hypothetical protein
MERLRPFAGEVKNRLSMSVILEAIVS